MCDVMRENDTSNVLSLSFFSSLLLLSITGVRIGLMMHTETSWKHSILVSHTQILKRHTDEKPRSDCYKHRGGERYSQDRVKTNGVSRREERERERTNLLQRMKADMIDPQ